MGIPEVKLELRPEAQTLGLTLERWARLARGAVLGATGLTSQVRYSFRCKEAMVDG